MDFPPIENKKEIEMPKRDRWLVLGMVIIGLAIALFFPNLFPETPVTVPLSSAAMAASPRADFSVTATTTALPRLITPVYQGNGVYLFRTDGLSHDKNAEGWRHSLVHFIGAHPELRILNIAPYRQGGHGSWFDVLVITEPREAPVRHAPR